MASIWTSPSGTHRIQFIDPLNAERRAIYLGKMSKKSANEIKLRVEYLISAKAAGQSIDAETARWLGGIGEDLHAKLAAIGLSPERVQAASKTLSGFIGEFIAKRAGAKLRTIGNLKQATDKMITHFGGNVELASVTVGSVDDWILELRKSYAPAYVSRLIKYGKQIFHAARRSALITRSPFDEVKAGTMANPDRMFFVTAQNAERLIAACPNLEWRLIVALTRFGGLRAPSELSRCNGTTSTGRKVDSLLPRRRLLTMPTEAAAGFLSSQNSYHILRRRSAQHLKARSSLSTGADRTKRTFEPRLNE